MPAPTGLAALHRDRPAQLNIPPDVSRPAFRWRSRVLLPAAILASTGAVLAWAARDALWPGIPVRVVPVVVRTAHAAGSDEPETTTPAESAAPTREETIVQAPGWIEPAPFAVTVPALTDGVVKDVLVLEGQHVEAGQVVVRLIDDDARLALRRAEAELAERAAEVDRARSEVLAAQARAAEVRDEVERKRPLVDTGGISAAQLARVELRLLSVQAEEATAAVAVLVVQQARVTQQIACDLARLALDRTEVRTPVAGTVLSRSVEPGTRLNMAAIGAGEAHEAGVVRVYDPAHLQVRVDVPLADAARVGIGTAARIVTETLPDTTFSGTVTSVVHEANIQRNTVQFKVAIKNPLPALKPEMLARVRLVSLVPGGPGDSAPGPGADGSILLLPESVLLDRTDDAASVWLIAHHPRRGTIAARRAVTLGRSFDGGYIEVLAGVAPTERAIADPPVTLAEGSRVRVVGEADEKSEGAQP